MQIARKRVSCSRWCSLQAVFCMNSFTLVGLMPSGRLALPGLPGKKEKSRSKLPERVNLAAAVVGAARRRRWVMMIIL